MKHIITSLLSILISTALCAQDSISRDTLRFRYEHETIKLFSSDSASQKVHKKKLTMQELKEQFLISPDALKYFDNYAKENRKAKTIAGIALGCLAVSVFTINSSKPISAGFFLAGYSALFIALPHKAKASNAIRHAVWLRNRDVLLR